MNKDTAESIYKNRYQLDSTDFLISKETKSGVEILHFERSSNIVPQVKRKAFVNNKGEIYLITDGIIHHSDIDLS